MLRIKEQSVAHIRERVSVEVRTDLATIQVEVQVREGLLQSADLLYCTFIGMIISRPKSGLATTWDSGVPETRKFIGDEMFLYFVVK